MAESDTGAANELKAAQKAQVIVISGIVVAVILVVAGVGSMLRGDVGFGVFGVVAGLLVGLLLIRKGRRLGRGVNQRVQSSPALKTSVAEASARVAKKNASANKAFLVAAATYALVRLILWGYTGTPSLDGSPYFWGALGLPTALGLGAYFLLKSREESEKTVA